ncbi:SgcJ/EcaC family oxidoreductase [Glaesserella sp.]|uniref:YybH family protein n=1 Tax=Glaesserella sp. TaxID=2094731 RepID=UPI00359F6F09
MNKLLTTLLATTIFVAPIAQAQTQPTTPVVINAEKQDETAIRQLINDYAAALKSANPQNVVALYRNDGVLMPSNAPTAQGKNAITATYQHIFSAVGLDLQFDIKEITVNGNVAIVRSTSNGTATVKANNTKVPEVNRELFVLDKVDSKWKIARYMFNKTE